MKFWIIKKKYQNYYSSYILLFQAKKFFSLCEIFQVDFYPAKSPNCIIMHQCDEVVSFRLTQTSNVYNLINKP